MPALSLSGVSGGGQLRLRSKEAPKKTHVPARGLVPGICILLAAVTSLVFAQTLQHDFVNYDDTDYVYENSVVKSGLTFASARWAFTHSHARNWHPLTTLSHMLDCQFFGLRPGGHHFTNVLFHIVSVLCLFLLLRQMTGALWRSAFVAALFAIHPQHVESVAWIAERKDVLSGLFFMLTLGAYLRYARKPSLGPYVVMSILYACGLMSKPMLVTLPFVLLLLDYWPLGRFARPASRATRNQDVHWLDRQSTPGRLILEKIPLLALSMASSVTTFLIQKHGGAQADSLPLLWRVDNALVSYIAYIWQMIWPVNLAPLYPHPENHLAGGKIALALVLLIAASAIAVFRRRKNPYLVTGWFWYLGMLVPVVGIVQVGAQGWADRYTYLPEVGLYVLIAWGMVDLVSRWRFRRVILTVAGVLVIAALAWTAWLQTSRWQNSESLWTHTLAVTSNNEVAHNNFGNLLLKRGQADEALSQYERALEIRSGRHASQYDFLLALFQRNIGVVLEQKGRVDEAIVHYRQAIQVQPDYATAYLNLGHALSSRGQIDDAIAVLQQAARVQPEDLPTRIALAEAFRRKGMEEETIAQYEKALAIDPYSIAALNNLAWIFTTSANPSTRNGSKAVVLAKQAVHLSGGEDPFFLQKLAAAYAESGNFSRALEVAEQALQFAHRKNDPALIYELHRNISLYLTNTRLRDANRTNARP